MGSFETYQGALEKREDWIFRIAWKLPDEFFPLIGHTRGRYFVDELMYSF